MKSAHTICTPRLALLLAVCSAALMPCTPAAAAVNCTKGGYVTRVVQGWPMSDHVIGITIRDNDGVSTNWATQGQMDTNDWPAARSLMSFALTAFVTQTYVTVSVNTSWDCGNTYRMADGQDWHHGWKGLMVPLNFGKPQSAITGI